MNRHHRHSSLPDTVEEVNVRTLGAHPPWLLGPPGGMHKHRDLGADHPNPMCFLDTDGSLLRSGYQVNGQTILERGTAEVPLKATLVMPGDSWTKDDNGIYLPN